MLSAFAPVIATTLLFLRSEETKGSGIENKRAGNIFWLQSPLEKKQQFWALAFRQSGFVVILTREASALESLYRGRLSVVS